MSELPMSYKTVPLSNLLPALSISSISKMSSKTILDFDEAMDEAEEERWAPSTHYSPIRDEMTNELYNTKDRSYVLSSLCCSQQTQRGITTTRHI